MFTRFSRDPGFDMNLSILIDGNILDSSRGSISSAVMNTALVSSLIALILSTSSYPFNGTLSFVHATANLSQAKK
jgi:hypothetical protein